MNMKNKLKRFFTLSRNHDGFTLVELIVVIAIMAILAGVGSVGYAGYIKSANKKADMVLVGNIMRAIETGTYSTMFHLNDSQMVGTIPYPVGYVVLSTNANAQSNASNVQAGEVSGECVFTNATITSINPTTKSFSCGGLFCADQTKTTYSKSSVTMRYCTTHSKNQPIQSAGGTYDTGFTYTATNSWHTGHKWTPTGTFTINAGDFVAEHGISQLYEEASAGKCVFAANNGVVAGDVVTDGEGENPIYKALVAAFGEGLPNTNLKYDNWTSDDGVNYATFLNNSGEMIDYVQDTYGTLDTMVGLIDTMNKTGLTNINTSNYLSGDYQDASELMESFASHVIERHPDETAWKTAWNGTASYNGVDYTYGMNDIDGYHHDYVYSATKAYNQSFASYCEANGVDPKYTAAIINFTSTPNESGLSGMDALDSIPRTVNTAAFNGTTGVNPNYTLQAKFREIDGSDTDAQADAAFEQCKKLYAQYIDNSNGPSACEKNGETFYNMMNVMNETAGVARDEASNSGGNFFDYYNNYLDAFSAIYSGVNDAVKAGNIVILVTIQDGVVGCEVSPSAANPRPLND